MTRLVCVSDTHGRTRDLVVPDGDILLHAGDLTGRGRIKEIRGAHAWLASLPHRHKIVVAGNHDFGFERTPDEARAVMTDVTYLEDEEVTVEGLRIWGTPWQPWFHDWAFNLQRGAEMAAVWAKVPTGIDVLLTHGPPAGILDRTYRGEEVGCADQRAALARIRPRLCVFGHIHESYGQVEVDGTLYVNASTCNLEYEPVQPPIVVEL